jgi:hypothetical protein
MRAGANISAHVIRRAGGPSCTVAFGRGIPTTLSATQQLQAQTLHAQHVGGFVASRSALAVAAEHARVSVPLGEACSRSDVSRLTNGEWVTTFSHEGGIGGCALWSPTGGFRCALDIVDVGRISRACERRPKFAARWLPLADPKCASHVAVLWAVREVFVKIVGLNEAPDMHAISATIESPPRSQVGGIDTVTLKPLAVVNPSGGVVDHVTSRSGVSVSGLDFRWAPFVDCGDHYLVVAATGFAGQHES